MNYQTSAKRLVDKGNLLKIDTGNANVENYLPQLGLVIILVFALVFAGLVIFLILFVAWRNRSRKASLAEMGFEPVEPSDLTLHQKIVAIHQGRPAQNLALHNVFRRGIPWGDMYLFDLMESSGGESSYSGTGILAVVSSQLRLPFFQLIPQPDISGFKAGFLVQAAEKILQWAISQSSLVRVSFPDYAQFDRSYMVLGCDENEVRQFFTESRINGLINMERRYQIEAGNDVFTLNKNFAFNTQQRRSRSKVNLDLMISDARGVLELFL